MTNLEYLIIGGGMTADAAVQGIRSIDASGTIGLIAAEPHRPYKRPPLSKGLWKGDKPESVWLGSAKDHATVYTSRIATSIDVGQKRVFDDSGEEFAFRTLLLATGGRVRKLPGDPGSVIYFRTYDDYEQLRERATKGTTAVVIGGGFIGSEIAAALAMNGVLVTMIFPEEGIGGKVYPLRLSKFLNEYYASKGVHVLAHERVDGITPGKRRYEIATTGGAVLQADVVVAGIGIRPDADLAASAGLTVENGIVVNDRLETSHPGIYAAGDVANFFNPALDMRVRFEHEDNAIAMGTCAGKNMAGASEKYRYLPLFYSDLFDLGYEAVGEIDSRMETVEEWKEEFREGVVYYLRDNRVRGVLLWNTWGQVENARKIISGKQPFTSGALPVASEQ